MSQVTTVIDRTGYQHIVEVNHGLVSGPKGDTGATGIGSDEEAGWKLPVDEIRTTHT